MKGVFVFLVAVCAIGCASRAQEPATSRPTATPTPRQTLYTRIPVEIGEFKLTQRASVRGAPTDSLFRFSDGSRTTLTVIVYDIDPDVRVEADSQKWTAREGEKFKAVQEIQRNRGQIAGFVVAFSDTSRFAAAGRNILEHAIAAPTRFTNGSVAVEMQYLYLIEGKFVKVRATIPQQGWEQTRVPSFSRELARRVAGGV